MEIPCAAHILLTVQANTALYCVVASFSLKANTISATTLASASRQKSWQKPWQKWWQKPWQPSRSHADDSFEHAARDLRDCCEEIRDMTGARTVTSVLASKPASPATALRSDTTQVVNAMAAAQRVGAVPRQPGKHFPLARLNLDFQCRAVRLVWRQHGSQPLSPSKGAPAWVDLEDSPQSQCAQKEDAMCQEACQKWKRQQKQSESQITLHFALMRAAGGKWCSKHFRQP